MQSYYPNIIYPCLAFVSKKSGQKWLPSHEISTCVKIDEDGCIFDLDYIDRLVKFKAGADKKNLDKYRLNKVEVDFSVPLVSKDYLNAISSKTIKTNVWKM